MTPEVPPILVINPNSRRSVTDAIAAAVRTPGRRPVECVTAIEAPAYIMSEADIALAARATIAHAAAHPGAAAVVIACYAQPGLAELRQRLSCPVVGIQDAAIATALACGAHFGVIALSQQAIPRHLRRIGDLGLSGRLAGEIALDCPADAPADAQAAALVRAGQSLADGGADCVILGCAGLSRWRGPLTDRLGLPVLDPTVCAVNLAEALVA